MSKLEKLHRINFSFIASAVGISIVTVLLRTKKVGHQIFVSFENFDVVQGLFSFFLTLF
jgi:hypothetical protein